MLTNIKNDLGIITYNETLVNQILNRAIKPMEDRAKYIGDRQIRYSEDGLFVYAGLSIRLGYSMKDVAGSIISFVADSVENILGLPVEDIVIEVIEMTTSKTTVKRNVRYSLRGEYGEYEEE